MAVLISKRTLTMSKFIFLDHYNGRLNAFRHTTLRKGKYLSSTRVVNKFVKNLGEIDHHSKLKLNVQAELTATLKLISYEWNLIFCHAL